MNEHVLLVMKYLDDSNSVTKQELLGNCKAAAAVYVYAHTAPHIAAATASAIAVDVADAAVTCAACAHHIAICYTKKHIDRYFVCTGENKEDYIDEITTNKGDK